MKHFPYDDKHHSHTLKDELFFHLPYAVFAIAFSLIILSFFDFLAIGKSSQQLAAVRWQMFHSFHFMHIAFACVGTLLTFFKYSRSIIKGMIVGIISPSIFCVLSDMVFPWLGAKILGINMPLHICFFNEIENILPFLVIGFITGLVLSSQRYLGEQDQHSHNSDFVIWSHSAHIFISSLASSFYFVANGFTNWSDSIGMVFVVLIFAVLIPCTLSDVIIPAFCAKLGDKTNHKNCSESCRKK